MQVFKNKIVIISIFILIALIILVYTQFLSPVSFSLNSANWYVVDDIEFNSINYHYSEEYKNPPVMIHNILQIQKYFHQMIRMIMLKYFIT